MIVTGHNGELVDLPLTTYQEEDSEGNLFVSNIHDLELVVTKIMGYDSLASFEQATGHQGHELLGKWWTVVRDRIHIKS